MTCDHGIADTAWCPECADPLTVPGDDWQPGHITPVGAWIGIALLVLLAIAAVLWRINTRG